MIRAIKQFDLDNDEDVKALRAANEVEKGTILTEKKEKLRLQFKLDDEEQKEVDAACDAETIDATPDADGHIPQDQYLKIY